MQGFDYFFNDSGVVCCSSSPEKVQKLTNQAFAAPVTCLKKKNLLHFHCCSSGTNSRHFQIGGMGGDALCKIITKKKE
jgi:hypothetical protein